MLASTEIKNLSMKYKLYVNTAVFEYSVSRTGSEKIEHQ